MWRSSVVTASDHIFPGLAYHDRKKEFYDIEHHIKSSLPLQMALYFNIWLFVPWFLITVCCLDMKYYRLSDLYKFATITVFIVISVLECARLYLGYMGNLAEKIPELAGFWLISTLLQFPLEMFLILDGGTMPLLGEIVVNGIMLFLLVTEIITGTMALKHSADHHAKRFYLAQLYGIEDKLD
ncbi:transmembrane protein 17B [Cephus cinctus]|uniref:Transmembrane protein 17B n=1 Tax=Cephus cinctus TaxID=211228 RepID=A0AAJ7RRI8_CEPCN|nr:transmembrane protein 17B [Cephus cinctus]XP_015605500.1 transmembrane protein 17B [Cephus cinctus]XP_015605501.1 transmembrane protein 17B [Cephus cinctus]XP_015605502.1 transmembrane protein 17B [Cephus cinctus]XP_015605504.1 transmembrane protein 17B [Cephus cinctus]XP_024945733.1 transmembrane protein 17B [Cephus cinctus]